MAETLLIRPANSGDLAAIDALLGRSYPILLKEAYPPSVLVTAIPLISRAQPRLLATGTYFVVSEGKEIVGAGGWTRAAPGTGARQRSDVGHIRHVVTDHRRVRSGIGRSLMTHVLGDAWGAGIRRMECFSTLVAVPFGGTVAPIAVHTSSKRLRSSSDIGSRNAARFDAKQTHSPSGE